MKFSVLSQETKIVINEDGEVKRTEMTTIRRVTKDTFMQVYLDDFASLMKIREGAEYKTVLWIGREMKKSTNQIILVKANKQSMANEIGVTYRTLDNAISALVKKGVLEIVDRSVYRLNPQYFFKGSIDERRTLLKRTVEYEIYDNESDLKQHEQLEELEPLLSA